MTRGMKIKCVHQKVLRKIQINYRLIVVNRNSTYGIRCSPFCVVFKPVCDNRNALSVKQRWYVPTIFFSTAKPLRCSVTSHTCSENRERKTKIIRNIRSLIETKAMKGENEKRERKKSAKKWRSKRQKAHAYSIYGFVISGEAVAAVAAQLFIKSQINRVA